jgi:hypothetical protein
MSTLFLSLAVFGLLVLAFQFVAGLFGLVDVDIGDVDSELGAGFELVTVRTVAAGAIFFGFTGLIAGKYVGYALAVPVALLSGFAAMLGVAFLMKMLYGLEHDGSLRIENAVGLVGTVYLNIPGGDRPGKIHLALQGRTVELLAVSDAPLANGASVLVIDVLDGETVSVIPSPQLVVSDGIL